jgi:transmembrane sensor
VSDSIAEKVERPCGAVEVDTQAMEFILRCNLDDWTSKDQDEFDAWLAHSLAHRAAYWRLKSVWERADRLTALRPHTPRGDPASSTLTRGVTFLRIAAALVLIAVIGTVTKYWPSDSRTESYATAVGGHKNIELADGSKIELNTDTVLNTNVNAHHRSVELVRGEALFRVKHDSAHPFVVIVAKHRVVDLGTSFLIRKKSDRLEVALLEGRARLESDDAQDQINRVAILVPGDEAVVTSKMVSVVRKSPLALQSELGWRRGVLVFHRATLTDVADEYNRYNSQKIVIADASAGARVISATLPVHDVAAFARIARNFLGLHVDENSDEVVISR